MTAQYWTITGDDMWRLKERTVFDFTNLNTKEVVTLDCVTEVKEKKFLPITMPKIKQRKAETTKSKMEKVETAKSSRRGPRARSKYKGVRVSGKKFIGQYWDKDKKKLVHLGTFDYEVIAAAAVQKALGNKKEAMRLLNEYQEGNGRSEVPETLNPASRPSEQ